MVPCRTIFFYSCIKIIETNYSMNLKADFSNKQKQILKQKISIKIMVAGGFVFVASIMLLIYFNISQVEEMKAKEGSHEELTDKPSDMNVIEIKVEKPSEIQKGANFKIAKSLNSLPALNNDK